MPLLLLKVKHIFTDTFQYLLALLESNQCEGGGGVDIPFYLLRTIVRPEIFKCLIIDNNNIDKLSINLNLE